ncbi:hypothetical protein NGRA_2371 [Nosema granulosis]|uniref:Uncharacterized protein n=1 Tax=Nosema granulosis TaxID=83296 RepID=A0A9P6KYQ2_9MICR|nr:hypothetical protein NGRA_2371 [Nosema granulosis]
MFKYHFYPSFKFILWQGKDKDYQADTKLQDINRFLLRLSITFMHFIFFKIVEQGDTFNIFTKIRNTIIILLSYNIYALKVETKEYYKISTLIFFISFLLIPITHTLTKEICYDTIYFYHFFAQLIFVINSVYFFIHQERTPRRTYSEVEVLRLEESINIPRQNSPSMNYGHSSMMIGVILLSSRFINLSSVFCFLSISLIFFICIPRIQEIMEIHKSMKKTAVYLIFVLYLLVKNNKALFYVLFFFIVYIYLFYYILMCRQINRILKDI